ncbi:MAG: hypothetical protein NTW19_23385 [Planctomycetota bacterium]|nr:hypothetical protein [Planctomycetota bacterium]
MLALALAPTTVSAQTTTPASATATARAGDETDPAATMPAAPVKLEAPLVDWANALTAHRLLENWTNRGTPPGDEAAEPIIVTGVVGARVTLRWLGRTVGAGEAFAVDRPPGAAVDLVPIVRSALNKAMAALIMGMPAPVKPGTKNPGLSSEDIARVSLVDLQIARELEPILINNNADDNAIYYQFIPGFHGLKMSRDLDGKTRDVWIWPASALALRITRKEQVNQLMRQLSLAETLLPRIARPLGADLGVAAARFEVIHLARAGRDMPPALLQRGNVVLPPEQFTDRTLDAMADRLAAHLLGRIREDGQITGGYQPSTGRHEPANASDEDTALAAFVLGQRIRYLSTHDAGNPRQLDADVGVRRLIKHLVPMLRKDEQASPNAIALTLLTLAITPDLPDHAAVRAELAAKLLALRDQNGRFRVAAVPDSELVNSAAQALIIAALASQNELAPDPKVTTLVQDWRAGFWSQRQSIFDVMSLPWAIMTESFIRRQQTAEEAGAATQPSPLGGSIFTSMKIVREHQITKPPAKGPADVLGGFEIESQKKWLAPDPDWRSAFAVAFLATALREPGVVPVGDRPEWSLACGQGARFLAQLMFDAPGTYYVQFPSDAIGGVRVLLWDNHLGIAPTAMSLLATVQLQETLAFLVATDGLNR